MVTSLGEKGFCTNFYDTNDIDYYQIQNNGFHANEKLVFACKEFTFSVRFEIKSDFIIK